MTVLLMLGGSLALMASFGWWYSRFLSRSWGSDPSRPTPAVTVNDGRDYVPSPTPVVFAHHFASIAGAGPIVGPVIAVCWGWLPALLWVVFGGLLIGAVHDYLAAYMATREGGQSIATVARRLLGTGPFLGLMFFLVVALALVCATFLNLSAQALTSMVPFDRLGLDQAQTLFRVAEVGGVKKVVIGGIASMSVIVITAAAPLVGWMYIKKQVAVWKCSLVALAVCALSVVVGLYWPVALSARTWQLLLAAYVLVAAGAPVWLFLQSRDFINVHILYAGMAALVVTLVVAALRSSGAAPGEPLPALDPINGPAGLGGALWPALFITIACGAVSGFHSLCAGGTTCKQLKSESAVRVIGYGAMCLESLLAVCVIAVMLVGVTKTSYFTDVHPGILGLDPQLFTSNPVLGFAMAVGNAGRAAWGLPVGIGALAGMILLEGFLVTTLDTAVRLCRYLLEEIWRVLLGTRDPAEVEAEPREAAGTSGIPPAMAVTAGSAGRPFCSRGPVCAFLTRVFGHYWVNSGLAVALMLAFAFSGGSKTLWNIFAGANQLLAALVLTIGALWLLKQGRRVWPVLIPAAAMLVTALASLILSLPKYAQAANYTLLVADLVLLAMAAYLVVSWGLAVRGLLGARARTPTAPRPLAE